MINDGLIERVNTSGIAFYTLKGVPFKKSMTDDHMGVSINHSFYHMIKDLPLEKNFIHNIRLRFGVKDLDLWKILSINSSFKINPFSKDIKLASWQIEKDIFIGITLHRTNTVSINIGCSSKPFPLDFQGILDLSNILTRIEERISNLVQVILYPKDLSNKENNNLEYLVPSHKEWEVTMWHFGADSRVEYSGKKFAIKWDIAEKTFVQLYSKDFKDKKSRIRLERQESPNKRLLEVIEVRYFYTSQI